MHAFSFPAETQAENSNLAALGRGSPLREDLPGKLVQPLPIRFQALDFALVFFGLGSLALPLQALRKSVVEGAIIRTPAHGPAKPLLRCRQLVGFHGQLTAFAQNLGLVWMMSQEQVEK